MGGRVRRIWEDNIVTDLLKALLGNGSVKAFQHTRHATIRWKCFLCDPRHATIRWKCFLCGPRRVYVVTVVNENYSVVDGTR
jgi:hypothetical protein